MTNGNVIYIRIYNYWPVLKMFCSCSDSGDCFQNSFKSKTFFFKILTGLLFVSACFRGALIIWINSTPPVADWLTPPLSNGTMLLIAPQTYVPTVFENYTACLELEEQRVELSLWDTSGTWSPSLCLSIAFHGPPFCTQHRGRQGYEAMRCECNKRLSQQRSLWVSS